MNEINLNDAIKNGKIYRIDNKNDNSFDQVYYYLINGLIRFCNMKKFKLEHNEETRFYTHEYFENTIVELNFEYMNLNKFNYDISIFTNNESYLVDEEGYHFNSFELKSNEFEYFVPKIWQKMTLYFLVPDEDTDYSFEISHGNYKEEEK